jgi:opacity protein-like surface antigen
MTGAPLFTQPWPKSTLLRGNTGQKKSKNRRFLVRSGIAIVAKGHKDRLERSTVTGGQMGNRFISIVCGSGLIVATSGAVFAADMPVKALPSAPPPAAWNWSGFYIGAGVSYNWTRFDQSLQGISGLISVFDAGVLTAQGQEGGPFFDFNRNKSGFAPDLQFGYIHPFAGGDWLAGLKFNYKYANIDSKQNVVIPQNGTGTVVSGPNAGLTGPITGFVTISPAEINLRHQLSLIGTIGRAFGNVTLYAGGGPALFGVESYFINAIPFATSSLRGTFAASEPTTAFNKNWVWGGAAQVGTTYSFAGGWFLDFAYTYARSANFTIVDTVAVFNQNGTLMTSGSAVLNAQERVTNQSVALTLNYQFH